MNELSSPELQAAIRLGAANYFDDCRGRVDDFIGRHFRYPGAWQTNRHALGWDLLRAPVNLLWAPVYVTAMLLSWLTRKIGWTRLHGLLGKVPTGFNTRVQRHIAYLIDRDLLQRSGEDGTADRLNVAIADSLETLTGPGVDHRTLVAGLDQLIADAMQQYSVTRTASADITNSLTSTLLGAFAFKKFTPGGIAIGLLLASWLAHKQAVERFILGDFLGSLYYGVFPAAPSVQLQVLGVLIALCLLAVFASLSGLITDPVQSWTGLHRRRLNKMIDSLQRDFEALSGNTFRPKDPYLARLLELLDVAIRL